MPGQNGQPPNSIFGPPIDEGRRQALLEDLEAATARFNQARDPVGQLIAELTCEGDELMLSTRALDLAFRLGDVRLADEAAAHRTGDAPWVVEFWRRGAGGAGGRHWVTVGASPLDALTRMRAVVRSSIVSAPEAAATSIRNVGEQPNSDAR